jgi:hypothetical protein
MIIHVPFCTTWWSAECGFEYSVILNQISQSIHSQLGGEKQETKKIEFSLISAPPPRG